MFLIYVHMDISCTVGILFVVDENDDGVSEIDENYKETQLRAG